MAVGMGSVRGPVAAVVDIAGLLALFVGERLIGDGFARWLVSGVGLSAVLFAWVAFGLSWIGSTDEARRVERLAFGLTFLGVASLGLYVLGSDLVHGPAPVALKASEGPGLRQVLQVAWPIGITCSLLPLIFMQWSLASMGEGRGVELTRVKFSTAAGASLAMLLCSLFLINAVANELDVHTDLSYFRTSSPSESSRTLVEGLDQETRALLFFPAANEVLSEVQAFFDELAGLSGRFVVERVDRAVRPDLAEKYQVSKEGTVVLERGGSHRKFELGDKLVKAKRKLRKLDVEFQTAFMKLSFKREVIYLIGGHEERSHARVEGDQRGRISSFKRGVEASNYTVKRLDALAGLSQAVPDDAAALLWIGPRSPLLAGELESIQAYLDRGGRLLLMLDPEGEDQPDQLLAWLGLGFDKTMLAHNRVFLPESRTPADRYNLITNKYSNHPATNMVSRFSAELAVVLPTCGSLTRGKAAAHKNRTTFLVRSMPNTWADADGDAKRSKDEALKVFKLAAALSRKIEAKEKKNKEKNVDEKAGVTADVDAELQAEMRVVVYADADLVSNKRIKRRAHQYLVGDSLRWLLDEARVVVASSSEEDVPVEHTRSEDVWWYYSTVFGVPLLIIGLGLMTGWGRRRKRRAV
jgi:hypothetical protein